MGISLGRAAGIALAASVVVGGGLLLAGCGDDDEKKTSQGDDTGFDRGPRPQGGPGRQVAPHRPAAPRPQTKAAAFAHAQLGAFDRNDAGGITRGETRRARRGRGIEGPKQWSNGAHGVRHWRQRVGYQRETLSIADAFAAANRLGTKDNRATWTELTRLAARFDKDSRPGLSTAEKSAFQRQYHPDVVKRENVWTGWDSGTVRPPRHHPPQYHPPHTSPGDDPDPYPSNPYPGHTSPGDDRPSSSGGHTSPGDDFPSGGGHTSPGDDHGSGSGSGSTSHGDDPPRYDPPAYHPPAYDPPSYNPPSGGGNSTDNGNPSEDDF